MAENASSIWIFANGEIPDLERLRGLIQPGERLIAADGGFHHLQKLGLTPERVIGDLDSLLPDEIDRLAQSGVPLERYPVDKDETDLELAILRSVELGFSKLRIAGALGGRLDQSLGNLFLLLLPELAGLDVRLEDGTEQVWLIRTQTEIVGRPGDTVSLLPFNGPAGGVTTQGLKYPLMGETLFQDRTRGISNVLLAERGRVHISSGMLICILRRDLR